MKCICNTYIYWLQPVLKGSHTSRWYQCQTIATQMKYLGVKVFGVIHTVDSTWLNIFRNSQTVFFFFGGGGGINLIQILCWSCSEIEKNQTAVLLFLFSPSHLPPPLPAPPLPSSHTTTTDSKPTSPAALLLITWNKFWNPQINLDLSLI